jgi:hypothetical protein
MAGMTRGSKPIGPRYLSLLNNVQTGPKYFLVDGKKKRLGRNFDQALILLELFFHFLHAFVACMGSSLTLSLINTSNRYLLITALTFLRCRSMTLTHTHTHTHIHTHTHTHTYVHTHTHSHIDSEAISFGNNLSAVQRKLQKQILTSVCLGTCLVHIHVCTLKSPGKMGEAKR